MRCCLKGIYIAKRGSELLCAAEFVFPDGKQYRRKLLVGFFGEAPNLDALTDFALLAVYRYCRYIKRESGERLSKIAQKLVWLTSALFFSVPVVCVFNRLLALGFSVLCIAAAAVMLGVSSEYCDTAEAYTRFMRGALENES